MNPATALIALAAACASAGAAEIMVSAAASLSAPLARIEHHYEAANPEVDIVLNTASSGALARQIENGAPVDVFIPAAPRHLDELESAGLVDAATRRDIAGNTIVLVAPATSTSPDGFDSLAAAEVVMIGDPAAVPAGMYAMQVLEHLALDSKLRPALVHGLNVRHVAAAVAAGHADAGFVYASEATDGAGLRLVARAPVGSHDPVIYPGAVTSASSNPNAALHFLDFLASSEARHELEQAGFDTPRR
jgi:molybdate transport system substrate-binding protein